MHDSAARSVEQRKYGELARRDTKQPVSRESVELINRAYRVMNSGDLEAAKAMADPNIELRTRFTGVAGRVYRGLRGVEEWFGDVGEAREGLEQTVERMIEVRTGKTIAVVRFARKQGER